MRLNPELFAARSLLIQSLLRSHQPEKADAEFQTLLQPLPRQPRGLATLVSKPEAGGATGRESFHEAHLNCYGGRHVDFSHQGALQRLAASQDSNTQGVRDARRARSDPSSVRSENA